MTRQFHFTITVAIDEKKVPSPGYLEAFKESTDEFVAELEEFLNKHPFIEACQVNKTEG